MNILYTVPDGVLRQLNANWKWFLGLQTKEKRVLAVDMFFLNFWFYRIIFTSTDRRKLWWIYYSIMLSMATSPFDSLTEQTIQKRGLLSRVSGEIFLLKFDAAVELASQSHFAQDACRFLAKRSGNLKGKPCMPLREIAHFDLRSAKTQCLFQCCERRIEQNPPWICNVFNLLAFV